MGIILPFLNFAVLFLLFSNRFSNVDWRHAFIWASLACGALAVLGLEILSPFYLITFPGVAGFWLLTLIIMLALVRHFSLKLTPPVINFSSLSKWDKGLVLGVIFIAVLVGFTALKAPPNTYDSMTYHMSRVAHWVQNKTLTPFPTNIIRQNAYTPFAEFGILHLQILSQGDRFANCVQWFSMIGSIIGVSLIAQLLGVCLRGQILASVLVATIPMGILQGSSTQTDYVTAFWLVCLVYSGLLLLSEKQWPYAILMGASLGLAALTKGTSYFYSIPFIVFILISGAKIYRLSLLKIVSAIAAATLLLNAGFYARNLHLQKSLISKTEHKEISNEEMNLPLLASNIIKNLSLHWGTPSESINLTVERAVLAFHSSIGVRPMDARISWDPDTELHIGETSSHEDNAGNLLHFILNMLAILLFLSRRSLRSPTMWGYLAALLSGFILFNLYMRWAPWHSRYHLPLFVLFAPFTAIVFSKMDAKRFAVIVGIIALLAAMPWVWGNKTRAFFKKRNMFNTTRLEQYFYNKHGFLYSFEGAVKEIMSSSCRDIGIITSPDGWEYPYWVLFHQYNEPFRFEHIQVKNISQDMPYPLGPFSPCAILEHNGELSRIDLKGKTYVRVRQFAHSNVFLEDTDGTLSQKSLVYHFNKFLEETRKLYAFMAQHSNDWFSPERKEEILQMLKTQINNIEHLDVMELNKIYPELGDHLKGNFGAGLEMLKQGIQTKSQEKIIHGQRILAAWNVWFEQHVAELQKAFEGFQSGIKK